MKNSIRSVSEDMDTTPESLTTVSSITQRLSGALGAVFGPKPSSPRRRALYSPGIEGLEQRVMMTASPIAAEVCTIEDHAHNEAAAQQEGLTTIVDTQSPIGLSSKTPHFLTDYLSATPENPVTVEASMTFEHEHSYPSLLIARSEGTDHRNGLRDAIYVQIGRNGNGNIMQFLGSDDNRQSKFTFDEIPVGETVDAIMTYDGSEVTISVSYKGTEIAQHSFTPPNAFNFAEFGISNIKWDSSAVSATMETFKAKQGKALEHIDCVEEEVAISPEIVAEQQAANVLASTTAPFDIAYSAPVYLLEGDGFIDVSDDAPLTIRGNSASGQADVAARLAMITNKNLAHRNQIQEGIIGQATLDGWGVIYQLHGNGEDERNVFQYPALPNDATIDMELSYDGDVITLILSTNDEVFAEQTLQAVNGPSRVAPAVTDSSWDSEGLTTWNSTEVSQGGVVVSEEIAALDSVFADPALLDSLLSGSTETTASEQQPIEVASLEEPIGLASKTPKFLTDYLSATPEDPVTVEASMTFEHEHSYPSLLIARSEGTDHRNGLRDAIYVQIGRNGNGNIMQFLGSDDNRQSKFTFDEIPVGETVEATMTYDGSEVTISISHEGTEIAQHSFTPPNAYNSARLGGSNMEWDTSTVTTTLETFAAYQGYEDVEAVAAEALEVVGESVPYPRMHVSNGFQGDQPTFIVQYASNKPQTYIELIMEGGGDFKQTIEHPNGEADGRIEINMNRLLQHNHTLGGNVTISMYENGDKIRVLDSFTGNYSARNNITTGQTPGAWGDLEAGRTVENPYTPTINVPQISGPNLIVSIQSPHDSSHITLDGGGYMSHSTLLHEGGTELMSTMLTFNAENPEGDYYVRVNEGRHGRYVTGLGVHWDPATKELTMTSKNPTMVATADTDASFTLQAMRKQLDAQSSVADIDIHVGSLRNVQDTHLYEASTFYIDADDAGEFINNSLLKGHPDASQIFHQTLSGYEAALKESLRAAAKIAVAGWNGESQREANDFFEREHGRVGLYRYLREFTEEFGTGLPSADAVREEGMRLAHEQVNGFVENAAKELSLYKRESYLANQEGGKDKRFLVGSGEEGVLVAVNSDGTLVGSDIDITQYGFDTVDVDGQRYVFGAEIERILSRTDFASQIKNAFNNNIPLLNQSDSDPVFTWVEQTEETSAYYISRPLQLPGVNRVASHNFIVTDAKFLGDPDATVFSFGHNDSGDLGMVDYCTVNPASGSTHIADRLAWLSLAENNDSRVDYVKLNADSEDVRRSAFSVIADNDYAMFSGAFGANSNSAAHAVANNGNDIVEDPSWRLAIGAGNYDKIRFGSFVRENGCGSGIFYGEDLDSNPAF